MQLEDSEVRYDSFFCIFSQTVWLFACLQVVQRKISEVMNKAHVWGIVHVLASYVSQTNIHILLEASQLQDDLLQKDNDLHELRDTNAILERKVSWIYFSANTRLYIGSIPFDQQLRSRR